MAVIGREFAAVFVQFKHIGLARRQTRHHARLFRQATAFAQIARAACRHHIFPCGAPAGAARNDMVECQFAGRAAILAFKPIAQRKTLKRVKAGCLGGFT